MENIKALIISLALLLSIQPTLAASPVEINRAVNDGLRVCRQYDTGCNIKVDNKANLIGAFTIYNNITVHKGLAEIMTEAELRSVIYHEVAHAILRHSERGNILLQQYKLDKVTFAPIRIMFEMDADKLACYLLYMDNQVNRLDSALYKIHTIGGVNRLDENYGTHPVARDRIKSVQLFKGVYGN